MTMTDVIVNIFLLFTSGSKHHSAEGTRDPDQSEIMSLSHRYSVLCRVIILLDTPDFNTG